MAGKFFKGLGQTIVGSVAVAATLGQNDGAKRFAKEGIDKVKDNAEEAWHPDGEIAQGLEKVPGVGYIISASHGMVALTGEDKDSNVQRARRASASATKSTLVSGGALAGGMVGGPAGAAAGATLGSAGGQCAEKGINHKIDEKFQTDAGTDFKAEHIIKEAAIEGTVAGISSVTTTYVGKPASRKFVGASLKGVGGGGMKRYVKKRSVEAAISKPVTRAAYAAIQSQVGTRK